MAINLSVLDTYTTGIFDQGAAEIPAYDPTSQTIFVVNGSNDSIDVLNASDPSNLTLLGSIDLSTLGSPNSVAIKNGIVAVALAGATATDPGTVALLDLQALLANPANPAPELVTVGALPDMLTFTPDGTKILVANEGEPGSVPGAVDDPEGSVSIIDISAGITNATVQTATFTSFNADKATLEAAGVRFFDAPTVAQDVEPEYIAVSSDGTTAWVALQEANALAVLDIATATITSILPLGLKDHSLPGNGLDASDRDNSITIQNWPVFGMYMPDAIATYDFGGQTYIVTANEGDDRGEDERIGDLVNTSDPLLPALDPTAFPNAATLQQDENLGRLGISTIDGDTDNDGDYDRLQVYGTRSFSIFDANGNLVFDSGDALEQITAQFFPNFFNASNDNNDLEDRSDNKGPEPEGIALGAIAGRTYAFVGLERIGGVMVYDITNPNQTGFVQYINPRDFSADVTTAAAGDLGPEGLVFVSAADSPTNNPLLIVANEISGSTTVFNIELADVATRFAPNLGGGQPGQTRRGRSTNDRLNGTTRNDALFGNGGNDTLNGRAGNDTLNGGNGSDSVNGSGGDDLLLGGNAGDRLVGGNGNDLIIGGRGRDTLSGGSGADHFRYTTFADGADVITDFQVAIDVIDLVPLLNRNLFDGNTGVGKFNRFVTLQQVGNSTRVFVDRDGNTFGSTNVLLATLVGVQASQLSASNFAII